MDGLLRNCATGCRVDEAFTMDDLVDSISADTSGLRCGHVQLRIVFITPPSLRLAPKKEEAPERPYWTSGPVSEPQLEMNQPPDYLHAQKNYTGKTLPRNAPTRWNFTSRIVSTVANNYDGLLQTFENIIADTTMDDDTLDCAKGFVRKLEDFEFVFMLYTYEQIFSETDVVFDIVQQRAMDVLYCKNRIESLLAFVKEKRSEGDFQAIYAKTADLTSDPRDEPMRKRRLTQLQDPQVRYRNLYMAILDNILEQIPLRFSNLESMLFLELVNPGKFDDMRQGNRGKLCDYLVFLKDMELDSAMPQLYKLFSLVATIEATSAGVERSFSCLKRLKSYTRNTMGQGRLSSLALLAIERTLVKSLEKTPSWYDRVTDHFLEKEPAACQKCIPKTPAAPHTQQPEERSLPDAMTSNMDVIVIQQLILVSPGATEREYNSLKLPKELTGKPHDCSRCFASAQMWPESPGSDADTSSLEKSAK
ncbi:Zinc finger MYM-type protein 1 [Anabarilius grahami]|uniref:Zinc finger MYM-type protein 1 n=1 Tax=Anabarilius grahami TaxID=495550 RepID=A0A3N0Y7F1_ANAGA|nr:Zinc finger MYM-type protein 1 [Anabarilius grahami]